ERTPERDVLTLRQTVASAQPRASRHDSSREDGRGQDGGQGQRPGALEVPSASASASASGAASASAGPATAASAGAATAVGAGAGAAPAPALVLAPALPLDAQVRRVTIGGRPHAFTIDREGDVQRVRVAIDRPVLPLRLEITHTAGTDVA